MTPFIRQVRAFDGEIVEIKWTAADGSVFSQQVTMPPPATRLARQTAQESAARTRPAPDCEAGFPIDRRRTPRK